MRLKQLSMAATSRVMAVRMHKVLARPWVVVRVCHLVLYFLHWEKISSSSGKVLCQAVLGNLGNFSKQPNGPNRLKLQTNCRNA